VKKKAVLKKFKKKNIKMERLVVTGIHINNYMETRSEYYVDVKSKNKSFELIQNIEFCIMVTLKSRDKTCFTLYSDIRKIEELTTLIISIETNINCEMIYNKDATFMFKDGVFSLCTKYLITNLINLNKAIELLKIIKEKLEWCRDSWIVYDELKERKTPITLSFNPRFDKTRDVFSVL